MLLKKSELMESMVNYYNEDISDDFDTIIEMIDSYDGYLGDDRYYDMSMFDELFYDCSPLDIVDKINFREFNSCDKYFKYEIYGIESSDEKDYSAFIDDYFMEQLIDNDSYLSEIEGYNYFDIETDTMIELIKLYHESERFETIDNEGVFSEDFFSIIDNNALELHHVDFLKEYLPTNCKAYNEVKKLHSEMYNNVA